MNLLDILGMFMGHFFSIVRGILVCLPCIGFLFLIGHTFLPKRFGPDTARVQYLCVTGAAVFTACCWYGVKFDVPLRTVLSWLCGALLVANVIRLTHSRSSIRDGRNGAGDALRFALTFSFYYAIAYLFLPSPFTPNELPISRVLYNNDVLHYIDYSSYLQRLGFENIANNEYIEAPYFVTPSVQYFFNLLAWGFGGDVMSASMPLTYGIIAIIGCTIANLAREIFRVSRSAGVAVGALTLSGTFFQYVYGNGFIPQYIASAVMLLGIRQILHYFERRPTRAWSTITSIIIVYSFVLLYTYPSMLAIFFVCLAFLVISVEVIQQKNAAAQSAIERIVFRSSRLGLWWGSAITLSLLLVGLFDLGHAQYILVNYAPNLTSAAVGWPLGMLPFYSLLGLPGPMQLADSPAFLWSALGVVAIAAATYVAVWKSSDSSSAVQKAIVLMAGFAYFAYLLYFVRDRQSYQQWKFASYFPLLWSWVWIAWAASYFSSVLLKSRFGPAFSATFLQRLSVLGLLTIATLNFVQLQLAHRSPNRFKGSYANLQAVDAMTGFDEMYVYMNGISETFFPPYFIRTKLLRFLNESYYASEDYDASKISPQRPLLLEGGECVAAADTPIPGVGCLVVSGPSLVPEKTYEFTAGMPSLPFIKTAGLTSPESWGSWANATDVKITVGIDREVLAENPQGFLNMRLRPFLPVGTTSQRVWFKLATGTVDAIAIDREQWVSIPYASADWSDGPYRKLQVDVGMLDLISPHEVDSRNLDTRRIGMGFIAISLSKTPQGKQLSLKQEPS